MGDVIGDLNARRGLVSGFTDRPGGMKMVGAEVRCLCKHTLWACAGVRHKQILSLHAYHMLVGRKDSASVLYSTLCNVICFCSTSFVAVCRCRWRRCSTMSVLCGP